MQQYKSKGWIEEEKAAWPKLRKGKLLIGLHDASFGLLKNSFVGIAAVYLDENCTKNYGEILDKELTEQFKNARENPPRKKYLKQRKHHKKSKTGTQ